MNEDQTTRIENKLDSIANDISEIKADLKYHILRTNLLEKEINRVKNDVEPLRDNMRFNNKMKYSFYFIMKILAAGAAVVSALKLLNIV